MVLDGQIVGYDPRRERINWAHQRLQHNQYRRQSEDQSWPVGPPGGGGGGRPGLVSRILGPSIRWAPGDIIPPVRLPPSVPDLPTPEVPPFERSGPPITGRAGWGYRSAPAQRIGVPGARPAPAQRIGVPGAQMGIATRLVSQATRYARAEAAGSPARYAQAVMLAGVRPAIVNTNVSDGRSGSQPGLVGPSASFTSI